MKISEFKLGNQITTNLAVQSIEKKKTKKGKDYLSMVLFDGEQSITANYWNYSDEFIPEINSVIKVQANINEWQGKLQINIIKYTKSNVSITEFSPKGDLDVDTYISKAYALANDISNPQLKDLVTCIIDDYRDKLVEVPGAKSIHHAYVAGTLKHLVDVAIRAKRMAEITQTCSRDLCIAGGFLHDIGKLFTYELNGAVIDKTLEGELLDHILIGISILNIYKNDNNARLIELIQHIIASHHGLYEYGSPVTPRFIEAWIVHFCDNMDAKVQTVIELNNQISNDDLYTNKEWSLEGQRMLSQRFIEKVIKECD